MSHKRKKQIASCHRKCLDCEKTVKNGNHRCAKCREKRLRDNICIGCGIPLLTRSFCNDCYAKYQEHHKSYEASVEKEHISKPKIYSGGLCTPR